jgi:hypothetical protein
LAYAALSSGLRRGESIFGPLDSPYAEEVRLVTCNAVASSRRGVLADRATQPSCVLLAFGLRCDRRRGPRHLRAPRTSLRVRVPFLGRPVAP